LSTAFTVSSASYANKSFSVSSQISSAASMGISSDGTKIFVNDFSSETVFEYELTTGFDIATASYTGRSYAMSGQMSSSAHLFILPDDQSFISGENAASTVYEYSCASSNIPSGYHAAHTTTSTDSQYWTDINSMTADETAGNGNIYYCVSTDDRTTWKVAKGTDGERSIVRNNSGTWQYNSNGTYGSTTWANATTNAELAAIQEAMTGAYSVTSADDLSTASLNNSFDVSGQTTGPEAVTFNPTGTRMIVGSTSDSSIKEYHLTTGFDVSTASFDSSYSAGIGRVDGVAFNSDGTKMYAVSSSSTFIYQFSLTTGFDISTASSNGSYNTSSVQNDLRDVQINNDGTKIYTIGDSDDQIEEYNLSTAYDVTTASHESSTSVSAQSGNPQGFCFNNDGTKLYVADESDSSGTVYQYTLSTAYDTSTLSYANKSFVTGNSIAGVFVNSAGDRLLGALPGDDTIKEYSLGTTSYTNQMNKTQLDAIPDANHFTLADDLDLAIIFNMSSGSTVPSSDGVAINYDANVLNQGAILGTDYNYDAPAQNKVRITSTNAANLKIRIV